MPAYYLGDEPELSVVIPDSIEPIIGWKALHVMRNAQGECELRSPSQDMIWPAKQRAEATCGVNHDFSWQPVRGDVHEPPEGTSIAFQGSTMYVPYGGYVPITPKPRVELPDGLKWSWEPEPHRVAGNHCSCGIYFVNTAEQALQYAISPSVICKVAMWGRVVQGSAGARGQYAYPQSIEFAKDMGDTQLVELAERYGLTLPESVPDTNAITNPKSTSVTVTYRNFSNAMTVSCDEEMSDASAPQIIGGISMIGAFAVFITAMAYAGSSTLRILLALMMLLVSLGICGLMDRGR